MRRPNPWPVRASAAVSLALTSLPFVIAVPLFVYVSVRIATGEARPTAAPALLLFAVVFFGVRLLQGVRTGLAGWQIDDLEREQVARAAGGLSVGDPTLLVQREALERMPGEIAFDLALLPGLPAQLADVCAQLEIDLPGSALVVPESEAVIASPRGPLLGAPALAALSTHELRAVLAYRLSLGYDRSIMRTARLGRLGATAGTTFSRQRGGWFGWMNAPAVAFGEIAERAGRRYAADARAWATERAAQVAPSPALTSGLARELVAGSLWEASLAAWQHHWATTSTAVRPLASWESLMWQAAASGTPVPPAGPASVDDLGRLGWRSANLPLVAAGTPCPPAPPLTALRELGGAHAALALEQLDELLAAAYFGDWIAARVGPRSQWPDGVFASTLEATIDDDQPRALHPLLTAPDLSSPRPLLELAWRQSDALGEALLRRGPDVLTVVHAIERAPVCPVVGAAAAGVALLAGDPDAPRRIAAWLEYDGVTACAYAELVPSLRFAGQYALAIQIEQLIESLVPVVNDPVLLAGLCAGRRMQAPQLPAAALQMLREAATLLPAGTRAYVISYAAPNGAVLPVLVTRAKHGAAPGWAADFEEQAWLLAMALPTLRLLAWNEVDTRVKKLGVKLQTGPVAAAPSMPLAG